MSGKNAYFSKESRVSLLAAYVRCLGVSGVGVPISEHIWNLKYRLYDGAGVPVDASLDATFKRVAQAAAAIESPEGRAHWAQAFESAMTDLAFLPAGRILAGAGSSRAVTLFNCFVMGQIEDDLTSIFDNVKQAALTMQQGGGIGHDFSTLRPKGAPVKSIGADASGPVSFMDVWDAMCRTIMSAGARRGAMMATLRCDHPDIEAFIDAKADPAKLRNFNLSVLVTDAFVKAVRADAPWDLVFDGRVYRTVSARALWDRLMRATYDYAEPGVVFIDRINEANNLAYCEHISATNPCGEQPLPAYGACLLGSINLARLVVDPFTPQARMDTERLAALVPVAVRFLDNVIDISRYPLEAQAAEARAKRRIGLGVTGLADALIMLGVRYGTRQAADLARAWMAEIEALAYSTSAHLAREKGAFPLYDAAAFAARPIMARLPAQVRAAVAAHGLRNGLLTSIAPTGTISLLAGNVSSGVEPVFSFKAERRVLGADGRSESMTVEDYAHALFRQKFGERAPLPAAFVTSQTLTPQEHLSMQAALQAHVDSSISKTINCPADIDFEAFKSIYLDAYDQGLKGCTTYRPNAVTGAVLTPISAGGVAAPEVRAATLPAAAPVVPDHSMPATADMAPPPVSAPPGDQRLSGSGAIVYMAQPLARDPVLAGYTYKIRWPSSDHAIYVTINDIETSGGPGSAPRRRPFEIFINSKNLEHYAWTVALTRMVSAIFRRGGDVTFVVEELKAVFDPQGGQWMGGRYVPSLLAAIGEVIETHLRRIGFLSNPDGSHGPAVDAAPDGGEATRMDFRKAVRSSSHPEGALPASEAPTAAAPPAASGAAALQRPNSRACPRCNSMTLQRVEGCWVCNTCGYARCG